jgi:hypothetical protein
MTAWDTADLARIGEADEMQISPRRSDGTLNDPVTIWVVRDGDDLYVRSYRGTKALWYRGVQARHEGHITTGDVDRDVKLVDETDPGVNERLDTAYRSKYLRHGAQYVDPMVAPTARETTLKLVPS